MSSLTHQPDHSATKVETIWEKPRSTHQSDPVTEVNFTKTDENQVEAINYIAHGILANIIVGVGIIGNILNLIVLTRPKLKGVMYVYLLGLAVSNLCVLITAIPALMDIAGAITSETYATAFFLAHLEITLLNSFMAASVYIIICMTVNRYISIYKPTHFQRIHTFKNAYIAIAFSFIGGMILHIPLAFQYTVVALNPDCESTGDLCKYQAQTKKSIANHALYRVYLWISEALLRLGPIVTLTILNGLIIVRFRRIAMKREVLKGGGAGNHRGSCGSTCNPPPSPYSTTNVQSTLTTVSTTTNGGNRLSVTQIHGKLTIPSQSTTSNGIPTMIITSDDRTASVYQDGITMDSTTNNCISRAVTPSPSGYSPSRMLTRGTPTRASSRRRGLHNPEERMLVVVLIAIVVLFVVCTTPAAFLSILFTDELKKRYWFALFRASANNLELLCFALNFFVYCLCSADIRRAFVDVLFDNGVVRYFRRKSLSSNVNVELANGSNQHKV